MSTNTPTNLMEQLDKARSENDFELILGCYASDATIVVEPGKVLSGEEVIRAFNKGIGDLGIRFSNRSIIEGSGVALHYRRWMREDKTTGETSVSCGVTTDILTQQPDGSWRISVDNPWGIEIFEKA
jgi:ketosteroid isomerase-like protein